ncbi:MAG TPA: ATP-binding protein [Ktedonobacteraceae bacterium]
MRFTVRSLGGKLVISAALMLLLCMLLFSVTSWYFLKSFYELKASNDATTHLASIEKAYKAQIDSLIENLTAEVRLPDVTAVLSQKTEKLTPDSSEHLNIVLAKLVLKERLSSSAIISLNHKLLADFQYPNVIPTATLPIIDQAIKHGKPVSVLQMAELEIAVPIKAKNSVGMIVGALLAVQDINDGFASYLLQIAQLQSDELNVALCLSKHMVGTTRDIAALHQNAFCAPGGPYFDRAGHYLMMSHLVPIQHQSGDSLVIVDVERFYGLNIRADKGVLILIFLGIFIITLGVTAYALIARTFFIRPLRRLQGRVAALVADNGDTELAASTIDELSMLSRSFSLLSESLSTRENESDVITRQMSDLLAMSDVLISTLNLEALLGEIVSRLGHIMQAKGVTLLLYGREMHSPWAVARWSNQQNSNGSIPVVNSSSQYGAVTVHTDPTGDITMTATTKMAAIAVQAKRSDPAASGKRSAIRVPKLTSQTEQVSVRVPRIPRPALRDLDMILARMSMQKQKIAYGEDIQMIYQERGEAWAGMALEAGYYSVIAVPLLLQDQVIGAIVLYGDRPYQVSRRDTFLLSTAAIQAAMAIQNALLFAEVKDKNAALERVNHLKSQFLATVTHELRTPLHSIISYGALILEGFVEGELTAEQEEHIQFIVRRAEDLSRLVDDMLDLSKIEADRLEVKVEPLALEPGLMEVVNQLKPMASNKGLQLTLEMEDSLPMVLADSHRIRQVVINMVSNALKFTEKGGVTIQCALLDRYDMLRISVNDTGIGISPAALDYIFEAFRQADGSTTRRFGGTGLGLTIARKLIELQGGEVSVESVVGQGSTFSFTLPVASTARVRV